MKANMFPRPEIAPLMKDFVLVDLYTDGTDAASEENAKMEEERYKTVSLPFYVILDPDEHVIATFPGSTRDVQLFAGFLKSKGTGSLKAHISSRLPNRDRTGALPQNLSARSLAVAVR
jgi:hypothetical protein